MGHATIQEQCWSTAVHDHIQPMENPYCYCGHTKLCNINDECMTLWGKPERLHMQNVEQIQSHDCHQNLTEHSTTSCH